jgi:bifunctional DNA-binding transcriptional regulator/antitoxin component of YhaV-PrlF toxin-antitoxin module
MGYPTKVQLIQRQASQQYYIAVPAALARSLGLQKGETIEWNVRDRDNLLLHRAAAATPAEEKKKRRRS